MALDRKALIAAIRGALFGGRPSPRAVEDIGAILDAWTAYGDGDVRKLAYVLATAFHESDRFKTMEEYASGAAYEGRRALGNTQKGDGRRFKGRGFVQITGRRNYADWAERTGQPLLDRPEQVGQRPLAARILVQGLMLGTFTGRKLADYVTSSKTDFAGARRVVNGTDRAALIARHADTFLAALRALEPAVTPAPASAPDRPTTPAEGVGDPPTPALIRSYQRRLKELGGYYGGEIDGIQGGLTTAAISEFQHNNGIVPTSGAFDVRTVATLMAEDAKPRELAPERTTATAADIRSTAPIVREAEAGEKAAAVAAVATGGATSAGLLAEIAGYASTVRNIVGEVPPWAWLLILAGITATTSFLWWKAHRIKDMRVAMHRAAEVA